MPLPRYALDGDAGADVCTAEDVVLAPGERALVGTGLAIALPAGYAAFRPPALGARHPARGVAGQRPGTVDSGYRGEIKLILINHDPRETLRLARGERVAQLVFQRVESRRLHRGRRAARVAARDARATAQRGGTRHGTVPRRDRAAEDETETGRPGRR